MEIQAEWFNIILINCYAPTEDKDKETKNDFYKQLEALYDTIPQNMVKIVLGDLNAKIGKEVCYRQQCRLSAVIACTRSLIAILLPLLI